MTGGRVARWAGAHWAEGGCFSSHLISALPLASSPRPALCPALCLSLDSLARLSLSAVAVRDKSPPPACCHRQTSTLHRRRRPPCACPSVHNALAAAQSRVAFLLESSLARAISTRGHSPALQLPAAGVVRSGSWPEKARPRSNVKSFRPQHRTLQSTQHHNIPLHQGIPRPVAIHCAPLARPSLHQFVAHRPPLLGRLRTFACLDRSLLSSLARVLAIDCIVPAWTFKGVK